MFYNYVEVYLQTLVEILLETYLWFNNIIQVQDNHINGKTEQMTSALSDRPKILKLFSGLV